MEPMQGSVVRRNDDIPTKNQLLMGQRQEVVIDDASVGFGVTGAGRREVDDDTTEGAIGNGMKEGKEGIDRTDEE